MTLQESCSQMQNPEREERDAQSVCISDATRVQQLGTLHSMGPNHTYVSRVYKHTILLSALPIITSSQREKNHSSCKKPLEARSESIMQSIRLKTQVVVIQYLDDLYTTNRGQTHQRLGVR